MMTSPTEIIIDYFRPGKEAAQYTEDLVLETDQYLKTFKVFPPEDSDSLTTSLRDLGYIFDFQRTTCITKVYFFHEYFDLLQFQDENQETLGYYSDVGTPLLKRPGGYQMTDWFLDIWLRPDGKLFELDMDEFEEALSQNLLTPGEADIARATFERLIREVNQGIYPGAYLK